MDATSLFGHRGEIGRAAEGGKTTGCYPALCLVGALVGMDEYGAVRFLIKGHDMDFGFLRLSVGAEEEPVRYALYADIV